MTRPALRIVRDDREETGPTPIGRRIRHALVCLDRTLGSEICLPHAQMAAEAFGAALTLAHVMPSVPSGGSAAWRTDVLEWEIARRESEQYLDEARELLAARVLPSVHSVVTQGPPAERIASTARELAADLVVVAGQPDRALQGAAIGATVQRLLEMTRASVLVVHGAEGAPPKNIVVPLDGSPRTESVLPSVISLAQTYGTAVTLLHVVTERSSSAVLSRPGDVMLAQQLTERLKESADEYLRRVRTRELRELTDVRCVVRTRNDERRGLLELVTQIGGDMVVLAAHGATCDPSDAFGGVASYMLAHARVPLLVLQDVAASSEVHELAPARRPSGIRRREDA